MDDDVREVLRHLATAIRDVTEQSFHAHELAEQALAIVAGTKPPDALHTLNSKTEVLTRIDAVIRKLQR